MPTYDEAALRVPARLVGESTDPSYDDLLAPAVARRATLDSFYEDDPTDDAS